MKKPLSDLSLLLRKSAFERVYKFYYTLFCKNTLFFSLPVCLEKWSFLSVLFRPLFSFFLFRWEFSFWKLFFSTSFDWMNAFFKTRGRKSRSTPNTLFSLWLFLWENSLLSIRFLIHTILFPTLYILLLSLKTHSRNSKRVFKGGLKRREFTKGLVLSFVLSLGTLYIVKKKEEDL